MSGPEVRIDLAALRAMHEDARSCPVETGGICVGPDEGTVSEYIPSGPDARRTASSYALDVAFLQPLLAAAEDRGLRFVGVHHVHPEGCARLSPVDERAAAAILKDPEWNVSRLLLPLTVRVPGGVTTRVFIAGGPGPAITEARLAVTSALSPATAARKEPSAGGERELLLGPARIERELDDLRARGYPFHVERRDARGTVLSLAHVLTGLAFVVPPEFPLSPPDVFLERNGERVRLAPASLQSVLGWSSLHTLAEIADEAFQLHAPPAPGPSRLLLRHLFARAGRSLARREVII